MNWKFLEGTRFLLPACLVIVMAAEGLAGYEQPVYSTPEKGMAQAENIEEAAEENAAETETAGALLAETAPAETEAETSAAASGSIDVADGVYEGSANGFGGQIRVRVTVADGKITAIEILSADGEDPAFLNRAKRVIDAMLAGQTTKVDTVSEATYSSRGIIAAVENALYQKEDTNSTAAQADAANQEAPQPEKVKESSSYKDGSYTGKAKGFGGMITVKVVIKKGKIHSIRVLSAPGEGADYLDRASSLIPKMIKKQTTNVDTVSGATFSSTGLINAVRNALEKAEEDASEKKKSDKKKSNEKKKNKKKKAASAESSAEESKEAETQVPEKQAVDASEYADGMFTGTGEGFEGPLTVRVTLKAGRITEVKLLDWEDDEPFITNASRILESIKSANSTDVDVISGATFSSRGILEAVNNALDQSRAQKQKEKGETAESSGEESQPAESSSEESKPAESSEESKTAESSEESKAEESSSEAAGGSDTKYIDGTYPVSATCRDTDDDFDDYEIHAEVTIGNDRIVDVAEITGDDDEDNAWFLEHAAKKLIPAIKDRGTAEGVDTVSGATCSSKAILELCRNALEKAER
ncbi:MAG: FMN-binding protein [Lachnospiraceae bacterium]|nr:FMN-binding protein [Lachnospiraceae bacterium]